MEEIPRRSWEKQYASQESSASYESWDDGPVGNATSVWLEPSYTAENGTQVYPSESMQHSKGLTGDLGIAG